MSSSYITVSLSLFTSKYTLKLQQVLLASSNFCNFIRSASIFCLLNLGRTKVPDFHHSTKKVQKNKSFSGSNMSPIYVNLHYDCISKKRMQSSSSCTILLMEQIFQGEDGKVKDDESKVYDLMKL